MTLFLSTFANSHWRHFWKNWKILKIFTKIKFHCSDTSGKNLKKNQNWFFIKQIILLLCKSNFHIFLAFFWGTLHIFLSKFSNFCFFIYKIFIDDQFHSMTSSSRNSYQMRLCLVSFARERPKYLFETMSCHVGIILAMLCRLELMVGTKCPPLLW